jgi:hypothetical protein
MDVVNSKKESLPALAVAIVVLAALGIVTAMMAYLIV